MFENCIVKNLKAEKTAGILLTVFTAVLAAVSAYFLWKRTSFGTALTSMETRRMLFELTMVFLLTFISFWHPLKRRLSYVLRFVVIGCFLWVHQIFTPVLLTGLYILYLILLGRTALEAAGFVPAGRPVSGAGSFRGLLANLLTGAALQVLVTCVFSAFGIGGAAFFRVQVLITAAMLLLVRILVRKNFATVGACVRELFRRMELDRETVRSRAGLTFCLLMSFIFTAMLLQAGRINIARDYDSLHYGLRSAFVLDNGRGIYESLGSVNDVYVYPKGFEILTLPLSGFRSDAYVQAFSWWMTVITLGCSATLVGFRNSWAVPDPAGSASSERWGDSGRRKQRAAGLIAAAAIAAIPGVMNMAASAKTDAVTLTFQLIGILFLLNDLTGEELRFPWIGFAAFVFTLTLKPTSFLFSFLPALAGLVFWAVRCRKEGAKQRFDKRTAAGIFIFCASLLATAGVTARTVLLAGVPLTTAGTDLWQKLGFELKYPFNSLAMGDSSDKDLIKRFLGLFACPVGEDMNHVYIAWGTLIVPVCVLFCLGGIVRRIAEARKKNAAAFAEGGSSGNRTAGRPVFGRKEILLMTILALTALACLYIIRMLWQLDGNYFMLLYVLCVICAFQWSSSPIRQFRILLPVMALSVCMCMVTNWAGVLGLSSPKFVHAGFVDRQQENKAAAEASGKGDVYDVLAENPRSRVLALADQPECFAFPCNVQSYTDLEGNGGNVAILAHYEDWLDFLDYMQADYLYVEDAFTAVRPRAYDLVGYMVDDELLRPVVSFDGGVLFAYDREYRVK